MTRGHPAGRWQLYAILCLLGAGWGLTQPLAKIAVSEGYRHFGLVFWQMALGAVLLGAVCVVRRRGLPLTRAHLGFYALIAAIGTVIPNSVSFQAAVHLPAGVVSIVISLVPMLAFPIAMGLGIDRFRWPRFGGLLLGLSGVALLSWPGSGALAPGAALWLPFAALAPLFYAIEGNVVAKWGTLGLDPVQTLAGASAVGAILAAPLALATGHFVSPLPPWGAPDAALLALAAVHTGVYTGFVWLVGRAGSVFAAQVAYLVTGFGVLWAMLLLGERYDGAGWASLGLMLAGLALVQPRPGRAVATVATPCAVHMSLGPRPVLRPKKRAPPDSCRAATVRPKSGRDAPRTQCPP